MPLHFVTVPEELIHAAEVAVDHLNERGFTTKIEEGSVEYPSTPTITATRTVSTHFVFVVDRFNKGEIEAWI